MMGEAAGAGLLPVGFWSACFMNPPGKIAGSIKRKRAAKAARRGAILKKSEGDEKPS
jgi:hypothetical protein